MLAAITFLTMQTTAIMSIFERFERGHRADQARGFGLGLWVARRIARLHGGDIQAAPSDQGGTSFTLTLPPRCGTVEVLEEKTHDRCHPRAAASL